MCRPGQPHSVVGGRPLFKTGGTVGGLSTYSDRVVAMSRTITVLGGSTIFILRLWLVSRLISMNTLLIDQFRSPKQKSFPWLEGGVKFRSVQGPDKNTPDLQRAGGRFASLGGRGVQSVNRNRLKLIKLGHNLKSISNRFGGR